MGLIGRNQHVGTRQAADMAGQGMRLPTWLVRIWSWLARMVGPPLSGMVILYANAADRNPLLGFCRPVLCVNSLAVAATLLPSTVRPARHRFRRSSDCRFRTR